MTPSSCKKCYEIIKMVCKEDDLITSKLVSELAQVTMPQASAFMTRLMKEGEIELIGKAKLPGRSAPYYVYKATDKIGRNLHEFRRENTYKVGGSCNRSWKRADVDFIDVDIEYELAGARGMK